MDLLAWVMMGLAIWHFTIWLPDRYWGGIVGALLGSLFGAIVVGLAFHGFAIPARRLTSISAPLEAIPGALVGIALMYLLGVRRERAAEAESVGLS